MLAMWRNPDGTSPTVGEILDRLPASFGGMKFTGTVESVADDIEELVAATDVDGFPVENWYGGAAGYTEFTDLLMPALRRPGLLPENGTASRRGREGTDG